MQDPAEAAEVAERVDVELARHAAFVEKTYTDRWRLVFAQGVQSGLTPQAALRRVEAGIGRAHEVVFGADPSAPKVETFPRRGLKARAAAKRARKARKRARR